MPRERRGTRPSCYAPETGGRPSPTAVMRESLVAIGAVSVKHSRFEPVAYYERGYALLPPTTFHVELQCGSRVSTADALYIHACGVWHCAARLADLGGNAASCGRFPPGQCVHDVLDFTVGSVLDWCNAQSTQHHFERNNGHDREKDQA